MQIADILAVRRHDPRYDEDMWRFIDQVTRNLRNLADEELSARWRTIANNILFVVGEARDCEGIEAKSFSSWWWLRCLFQTEAELARRSLVAPVAPEIPPPVSVRPDFLTERASAPRLWARVGEARYLIETLQEGKIRFATASGYDNSGLNDARRDRELEKSRKRPGQALRILSPGGKQIEPIGDVTFSTASAIETEGGLSEVEYWLSSYSTEFDPRLIREFSKGQPTPCDAILVIWEPGEMGDRTMEAFESRMLKWHFADAPVTYIDPYDLDPGATMSAPLAKDFSFAYQRELRMAAMPPEPVHKGKPFFLSVDSIADIAGLYTSDGKKVAGRGPASFLA